MMNRRLLIAGLVAILLAGNVFSVFSQPASSDVNVPKLQEARSLTTMRDEAGELWAVWDADSGSDVEIYFSRWNGRGWSAPKPVHSRPHAWDRSPTLVSAANGQIWLVWVSIERNDPEQRQLYASRWTGQQWTDPEAVPMGSISSAKSPVLAAPPEQDGGGVQDGTVWLAWVGFDGSDDEIFVSRWDGKAWLPPQQVNADDDDPSFYDLEPQLAVGRDGQPWVVWTGYQAGLDDEIFASHWTGDGWTPEQMVSRDDQALDAMPSLVLDAQDRPWVAWAGTADNTLLTPQRILTSRWEPTRSGWTDEALASFSAPADLYEENPTLALHSNGEMHLGWTARSSVGSGLAHVLWQGEQWTQPQLVRGDAVEGAAVLTFTADDRATFLQLVPSPDGQVPVREVAVEDEAISLDAWLEPDRSQVEPQQVMDDPYYRFLAFGDSITWGQYDSFTTYPAALEHRLDTRVTDSRVINEGKPGERTGQGIYRLKELVPKYWPAYVLYMEGSNDVTNALTPNTVRKNIEFSISIAKSSGVPYLKPMVATLIPRLDGYNDDTAVMNAQAVIPAAQNQNVALCDQWGAFYDYGPWQNLLWDHLHPNQAGLDLLASTFYDCLRSAFPWITEETIPPETWIEPLASQSYNREITVEWNGTDNMSWVAEYDVQAKVNNGAWTNWLLATQDTSAVYTGATWGDTVYFRVRGRDVVGNLGVYSAAENTYILAPARVQALPAYQAAPFTVNWWINDPSFHPVAYQVQFKIASGGWQDWLVDTAVTSASFNVPPLQYGQTYCFRVRARNAIGEWVPWSTDTAACTVLARYDVAGQALSVRHEPIIGADASLVPVPTFLGKESRGRFKAYLMTGGAYAITVSRDDLFGALPSMSVTVAENIRGLEFVLPPQDDVVTNGDFEAGTLSGWQSGGTVPPTLVPEPHTGSDAVLIGKSGESSWLSQPLSLPSTLTDATLSLMVKLDNDAAGSSTVDIQLAGTPVSHSWEVSTEEWTHVWLPVDAAVGQAATLTITVTDHPAIVVDEVRLGSAVSGGGTLYMPIVLNGCCR
ncbi:MAG TPA: GDSL-type esterase/lipase family protein [Anaerolineae bacterium]|nr:GDSL-type esterase/lipase family protein [Anaerolineae bacterium]